MGRFVVGDIVVLPFPFDDLTQSKKRPGVILANSWPNGYLIAAITSQEKHKGRGGIEIKQDDLEIGEL